MQNFKLKIGKAHPLGATPDKFGVNFSLFSENATTIQLLIFKDSNDPEPVAAFDLNKETHNTFHFWHCYIEGLKPGYAYTYKIDGPQDRSNGFIFNKNKSIIDPYAKLISNKLYKIETAQDDSDNTATSLRGKIVDVKKYNWEGDKPLNRPLNDTIIYEVHVGAFTKSPSSKCKYPGKFIGLIEKIPYLKSLGITAIELLPVFQFDDQNAFMHNGLKNFWGYGTLGYFSPHSGYLVNPDKLSAINEFRYMVKSMHQAGIEVILDVVFGYTVEGNTNGPVLSFKGIDNTIYYLLSNEDKSAYMDFSGCGNTLNCNHPVVSKFIKDCMEYWVDQMHVDGFRFDEASILSRGEDGSPLKYPPALWNIELSEKLADTKIIAEAWDAAGLYQVGYFPGYRWAEWNGHFRDDVRHFVRGDEGYAGVVASRIAGSADIYEQKDQLPISSVNFITAHDGFTMRDLVSYNEKHNEANGENNNDGIGDNVSSNYGAEGETENNVINFIRSKQVKNMASILLLSRGIPMILYGDEVGRTQKGNNNAYCQDSEISWFDWSQVEKNADILRFFKKMIAFRKRHFTLHDKSFFSGEKNEEGTPDITLHGCQLNKPGWDNRDCKILAMTYGAIKNDCDIHIMINMDNENLDFEIPQIGSKLWYRAIDTSLESPSDICDIGKEVKIEGETYKVNSNSIVVLISK